MPLGTRRKEASCERTDTLLNLVLSHDRTPPYTHVGKPAERTLLNIPTFSSWKLEDCGSTEPSTKSLTKRKKKKPVSPKVDHPVLPVSPSRPDFKLVAYRLSETLLVQNDLAWRMPVCQLGQT